MSCKVTITELESITGKTYRFLKRKFRDLKSEPGIKGSNNFSCREIIGECFKENESEDLTYAEVQLARSKAERRLAEAKAKKIEMDIAVIEGELITEDEIYRRWEQIVSVMKSKLLQIPPKIATRLAHLGDQFEIELIMQALVDEVLEELSSEQAGPNIQALKTQAEAKRQ